MRLPSFFVPSHPNAGELRIQPQEARQMPSVSLDVSFEGSGHHGLAANSLILSLLRVRVELELFFFYFLFLFLLLFICISLTRFKCASRLLVHFSATPCRSPACSCSEALPGDQRLVRSVHRWLVVLRIVFNGCEVSARTALRT